MSAFALLAQQKAPREAGLMVATLASGRGLRSEPVALDQRGDDGGHSKGEGEGVLAPVWSAGAGNIVEGRHREPPCNFGDPCRLDAIS